MAQQGWIRLNYCAGLVFICGLLTVIVLASLDNIAGLFDADEFSVKAYFSNVGDLTKGAPVRIGGVQVGRVAVLEMEPDTRIRVVASLHMKQPLPADSVMSIESTTVSGDTFISIVRGLSLEMITPEDDLDRAPELKSMDFFSIGGIGVLASDIGALAKVLIGDVEEFRCKEGKLARGVDKIKQGGVKLREEFDMLRARINKTAPIVEKARDNFDELSLHWAKIGIGIEHSGLEAMLSRMQGSIDGIEKDRALLTEALHSSEDDIKKIKGDIKVISAWFERLKTTGRGPLAVLLDKGCNGMPQTVTDMGEALQKVSDLSLLRKLRFYFNAQDVWKQFCADSPNSLQLNPEMLYNLWVKHQLQRRAVQLRQSHTACEIPAAQ